MNKKMRMKMGMKKRMKKTLHILSRDNNKNNNLMVEYRTTEDENHCLLF
jgi:hypothetical protein